MNNSVFYNSLPLIFILALFGTAAGYQGLTFSTGGGYSNNLYADSSVIGDSYLIGALSVSSTNFKNTKLRTYYDLSYFQYDTRGNINNFVHIAGIALYNKKRGQKLKWGIDIAGTIRDYVDDNSDFDNYKAYFAADCSYYLKKELQAKFLYRAVVTSYSGFSNLDYTEHWIKGEIVRTFRTKTTAKGKLKYSIRQFDEDNSVVDWFDLEVKLSQSLNIRTGMSGSGMVRWAGKGTRPLSSYFIVSGITSYWDPWDGLQFNTSLKRIFPYGIISSLGFKYWDRNFAYSKILQYELPWIAGKEGRSEAGWSLNLDINRQFNLKSNVGKAFRVNVSTGYISNNSDDLFYEYDSYFIKSNVEIILF